MRVLITGGAGFIGSHVAHYCLAMGVDVVLVDDLSTGYRDAVAGGLLVQGDVRDEHLISRVVREYRIEVVMHFASRIDVAESRREPDKYYRDNVVASLRLLDTLLSCGVRRFVFSSTAAVYGEPEATPIPETHPRQPINPYGRTKRIVEEALEDLQAHGLESISLRYFNAAGASPGAGLGERHEPETHLIPLVLQVASGRRDRITLFGNDYDTPDRTCIRDYVHVTDLAAAHWLAARAMNGAPGFRAYNLGSSRGYSNLEIIETARRVTGQAIPFSWGDRREGDPARLVADSRKARRELGWQPQQDSLERIIADAWRWEQMKGERW